MIGGFLLAATLLLTWPIAVSLSEMFAMRGDYFVNLWNSWWIKKSVLQLHVSPYWTDFLHYPEGISLSKHSLTPVNSGLGALIGSVLGPHKSFNILLLVHFWLSAWFFFLFARYLTGNTLGSILGGLVYSFCPFHYYYLAQMNVATLEFLPLAILFFIKTYRNGGARNIALSAISVGLIAASSSYYVIYAFIVACLLLAGGKLLDRDVPFKTGIGRLFLVGLCSAVVVVVVAWPLLSAALSAPEPGAGQNDAQQLQTHRVNDLLGYKWVGPPEAITISWPTMLGYSTLLLLVIGFRGVVKQRFWLLTGGLFALLGLGYTLHINGSDTGIPLLYRFLKDVPVLSMLRKPDRCFVMVQFVVALLCAFAWIRVSAFIRTSRMRTACWSAAAIIMMLELTGVPFERFDVSLSKYYTDLSATKDVGSLIEFPTFPGTHMDARYNYSQIFHEKKTAQGYVTNLAMTDKHWEKSNLFYNAYNFLCRGNPRPLIKELRESKIDLVILHKSSPENRQPFSLDKETVWTPFFLARKQLVKIRQMGGVIYSPLPLHLVESQKRVLINALGKPAFEDSRIIAFPTN